MKSDLIKHLIIFFMLSSDSIQYYVNKEFYFCNPTIQSIDFDMKCSNYYCIFYKNILSALLRFDDEFNFVYTLDEQKKVVYSNNGRIFYAECKIIKGIDIVEKVSTCHKDVLVNIELNGVKISSFLTKEGIIRETSTQIECPADNKQIDFENENKDFEIFKKNNLITIVKRNESSTELNFENFTPMEVLYEKFVNKSHLNMVFDLVFISFVMFFTLFYGIKKRFFLSMIWANIKRFLIENKKLKKNLEFNKQLPMFNENSNTQAKHMIPTTIIPNLGAFNMLSTDISKPDTYSTIYELPRSAISFSSLQEIKKACFKCNNCGRLCKGAAGLAIHSKACNKK